MASGREKRFTKTEWSWIFYDWANSIYATNIMAAIFPTIFVSIAGEAGDIGADGKAGQASRVILFAWYLDGKRTLQQSD